MRVLIVGCGYLGQAAGAALAQQGHEVFGLRRSSAGGAELLGAGIIPLIGDVTKPGEPSPRCRGRLNGW